MQKGNVYYTTEKYGSFTDEQIISQIKQGDEQALTFLLEKYKDLVGSKVGKYFIIGAEKEDIIQEGMIGLYKAIKNFETPIYYLSQLSPYTHSALRPTHIGIDSSGGFGKLMKVMQTLSRKSTDIPTHAQVVVQFQGVTDLDYEPQISKL